MTKREPDRPTALDEAQTSELLWVLAKTLKLEQERSEAIAHALVDIQDSVQTIYGTLIPKLLASRSLPTADVLDVLWTIREEFRHVEYHIQDAGLLEL
ncbi:MAG TPA: hypothetical protein V6D47_00495 [Oscillatoriaceae cyanobacterium]